MLVDWLTLISRPRLARDKHLLRINRAHPTRVIDKVLFIDAQVKDRLLQYLFLGHGEVGRDCFKRNLLFGVTVNAAQVTI